MAAYPITPQTTIVEGYAKFVADGKVTTEYVPVESEHSALSACIGHLLQALALQLQRVLRNLAFMWEELHYGIWYALSVLWQMQTVLFLSY